MLANNSCLLFSAIYISICYICIDLSYLWQSSSLSEYFFNYWMQKKWHTILICAGLLHFFDSNELWAYYRSFICLDMNWFCCDGFMGVRKAHSNSDEHLNSKKFLWCLYMPCFLKFSSATGTALTLIAWLWLFLLMWYNSIGWNSNLWF